MSNCFKPIKLTSVEEIIADSITGFNRERAMMPNWSDKTEISSLADWEASGTVARDALIELVLAISACNLLDNELRTFRVNFFWAKTTNEFRKLRGIARKANEIWAEG